MQSVLLYALTGTPSGDAIPSRLEGDFPAIESTEITYLDGRSLFHGVAADRVEEETRVPAVAEDQIVTLSERTTQKVQTEWIADLERQWVGIDSSSGEFLLRLIEHQHGVVAEEQEISLDDWAADVLIPNDGSVWGVNYAEKNNGGESIRAGSGFHKDATLDDVEHRLGQLSGIGFTYDWDDVFVRGSIFQSGYVAIFRDWTEDVFARWLAEEVLPYTSHDVEDAAGSQTTLKQQSDTGGEGGSADA